ncbi:acetamidase/formamidase family protein [Alkalicoccus halolimnae]|uniref:Acetamidase/formamidase family protein n=1 Tax=Alkalicoccus halolimnae TaxID=1667239 RepID=A0A5C7FBC5_9BACI|nr:acetamidase/formamidase family protein [Alkalicoccus halolimnae]TXF81319.1 acetamidase [Alkalicoccus halolimnae]
MTVHTIPLQSKNLRGSFSGSYAPVISVRSGDTLQITTPDIQWGYSKNKGAAYETYTPAEEEAEPKHPVIGPIYIEGAEPGMTVEIHLERITPGWYGRNWGGGAANWQNDAMQLSGSTPAQLDWVLDREKKEAAAVISGKMTTIPIRPFLGVIGLQPRGHDVYPTPPPYYTGGNIDCKELVENTRLYLPVEADGAGLYVGDGHAAQGDGEVSGTAIECPMDEVKLTVTLHKEMDITQPYAETPDSLITFGFDTDLNIAAANALRDLVRRTASLYEIKQEEAAALASAAADLRISQVVNGVKGVHGILPFHSIQRNT